jgi:ABC-type Fe3+ transport system substrate-binding protein
LTDLSAKIRNPGLNLQVIIPSEGTVAGMYIQFVKNRRVHTARQCWRQKLMIDWNYSR